MKFRRPLAAVVAALLLAGCGAPALPSAKVMAAKGLAAKGDLDDVYERIAVEAKRAIERTGMNGGLAAVLDAPTDAYAQRGLVTWYERTMANAVGTLLPEFDERLGELQMTEALKETTELGKPEVAAYIQKVADRLTAAAKTAPFKTFVVKEDSVNAFNTGGHFLAVHSALIAEVGDEAELAGVLAHEITHGLKRHAMQGVTRYVLDEQAVSYVDGVKGVSAEDLAHVNGHFAILQPDMRWAQDKDFVLAFLKGKVSEGTMGALVFRYNSFFANRTMNRDCEHASDVGSARILAAAGYDPSAITRVIDRWNDHLAIDSRYPGHPAPGDRIALVRRVIADEKLTGTDKGAERLAAIKALLGPSQAATTESIKSHVSHVPYTLGNNPWVRSKQK